MTEYRQTGRSIIATARTERMATAGVASVLFTGLLMFAPLIAAGAIAGVLVKETELQHDRQYLARCADALQAERVNLPGKTSGPAREQLGSVGGGEHVAPGSNA
jgi:hypothetical protein